jgi:hypothetical protein
MPDTAGIPHHNYINLYFITGPNSGLILNVLDKVPCKEDV